MKEFWWNLTGKKAVENIVKGRQILGLSDEEILEEIDEGKWHFDQRQKEYAKQLLKEGES